VHPSVRLLFDSFRSRRKHTPHSIGYALTLSWGIWR